MEPEEIDVVARNLALDDQRRLGDRLGRLERAVVFLLGDLRQLADRQQERVRDPVVGLNPDRIDPHGDVGRDRQLELPVRRVALGLSRRGRSSLKPNGAISRGFPARLEPLIVSSVAVPALAAQRCQVVDLRRSRERPRCRTQASSRESRWQQWTI